MTSIPSPQQASDLVRGLALAAGFSVVGIARAESLEGNPDGERFREWLVAGRHGEMEYLAREPERRLDPGRVVTGARSILCVGLDYGSGDAVPPPEPGRGRIARYARGRDYHKVFTTRLKKLEAAIVAEFPGVASRRYVDTGPVLEKLWAERAGVGWRGKHTNLVSCEFGSWLLLGELILDLDLSPGTVHPDRCGTCSRCITACPTGAITGPHQLDATLCISYLTIEHRGPIPESLRGLMGDHVFGCDDCLDVCPWNRFARVSAEADFRPRAETLAPLLAELVALDDEAFLARFAGTPVMRAGRRGLARNACVALGNVGGAGAVAALSAALGDGSALVREHAAWALGKLGGGGAREALEAGLAGETFPEVRGAIERALETLAASP